MKPGSMVRPPRSTSRGFGTAARAASREPAKAILPSLTATASTWPGVSPAIVRIVPLT